MLEGKYGKANGNTIDVDHLQIFLIFSIFLIFNLFNLFDIFNFFNLFDLSNIFNFRIIINIEEFYLERGDTGD